MINLKGLWIPIEILCDEKLNDTEKKVLALIIVLYTKGNGFYCNNYTLSKLFNKSKRQISRVVNNLETKKYVKIKMIYKENSKYIDHRVIIPNEQNKNVQRGIDMNINNNIDTDVYDNKNNKKIYNKKQTNLSNFLKEFDTKRQYSSEFLASLYDNYI